jgi:hypothetical protein
MEYDFLCSRCGTGFNSIESMSWHNKKECERIKKIKEILQSMEPESRKVLRRVLEGFSSGEYDREATVEGLDKLRCYFGKNDATAFQQWAYTFLTNLIKTYK